MHSLPPLMDLVLKSQFLGKYRTKVDGPDRQIDRFTINKELKECLLEICARMPERHITPHDLLHRIVEHYIACGAPDIGVYLPDINTCEPPIMDHNECSLILVKCYDALGMFPQPR